MTLLVEKTEKEAVQNQTVPGAETVSSPKKQRQGIVQRALLCDEYVVGGAKHILLTEMSDPDTQDRKIRSMKAKQPYLQDLERKLRWFLAGKPVNRLRLRMERLRQDHPIKHDIICQRNCIGLAGESRTVKYMKPVIIRAVTAWGHTQNRARQRKARKARYDCVEVDFGEGNDLQYMKVLFIFSFTDKEGVEQDCVFGRWFERIETFTSLLVNSQGLKWEAGQETGGVETPYNYDVIEVSSITDRVVIVPDFSAPVDGDETAHRFFVGLSEPDC